MALQAPGNATSKKKPSKNEEKAAKKEADMDDLKKELEIVSCLAIRRVS
jgi:hypothetical protein